MRTWLASAADSAPKRLAVPPATYHPQGDWRVSAAEQENDGNVRKPDKTWRRARQSVASGHEPRK
jgi:hypothetical protein